MTYLTTIRAGQVVEMCHLQFCFEAGVFARDVRPIRCGTPSICRRLRHHRLNERLRAEFIAGAEEEWRGRTGQPMTAE